jgi:hypothetical protein
MAAKNELLRDELAYTALFDYYLFISAFADGGEVHLRTAQ